MEGELFAIFLYQKLKEILTRYIRTILKLQKIGFQNLKGVAQILSPPRPFKI